MKILRLALPVVALLSVAACADAPPPPPPGGPHGHMDMRNMSPADQDYMRAMRDMHMSMRGTPMTGDADTDFLQNMIPHHQAAIDMAETELQYGQNPQVRALASRIRASQSREVVMMQGMLNRDGQAMPMRRHHHHVVKKTVTTTTTTAPVK